MTLQGVVARLAKALLLGFGNGLTLLQSHSGHVVDPLVN